MADQRGSNTCVTPFDLKHIQTSAAGPPDHPLLLKMHHSLLLPQPHTSTLWAPDTTLWDRLASHCSLLRSQTRTDSPGQPTGIPLALSVATGVACQTLQEQNSQWTPQMQRPTPPNMVVIGTPHCSTAHAPDLTGCTPHYGLNASRSPHQFNQLAYPWHCCAPMVSHNK
jgi:hypothetical protein